ncbi:hypothetical protein S83_037098 [Arachis hypogaea]
MCSNVLQPNPPYTIQHGFLSFSLTHSTLSLSSNYVPRIALLQDPKKIPSSSLVFQKINFFFTELCGLFGVLCLGQRFSQRKQGKREPSYLFPPSSLLCLFPIFLFLLPSFLLLHLLSPFSFSVHHHLHYHPPPPLSSFSLPAFHLWFVAVSRSSLP